MKKIFEKILHIIQLKKENIQDKKIERLEEKVKQLENKNKYSSLSWIEKEKFRYWTEE